ncbi:hypothetical protein FRB94_013068 [Tulasnella sp. JGI-2019a]|nr:hypothetical protein FRB93_001851 [Tulasnella sp. JGI-2019a]KAG9008661.1 hypothetical protein FRB94_013068 [Tulasnella sp. JGI-2019a]KAG9033854.1 hypothetical protein FRB95_014176 [Tulasnella sp. JGI-2019a]
MDRTLLGLRICSSPFCFRIPHARLLLALILSITPVGNADTTILSSANGPIISNLASFLPLTIWAGASKTVGSRYYTQLSNKPQLQGITFHHPPGQHTLSL